MVAITGLLLFYAERSILAEPQPRKGAIAAEHWRLVRPVAAVKLAITCETDRQTDVLTTKCATVQTFTRQMAILTLFHQLITVVRAIWGAITFLFL